MSDFTNGTDASKSFAFSDGPSVAHNGVGVSGGVFSKEIYVGAGARHEKYDEPVFAWVELDIDAAEKFLRDLQRAVEASKKNFPEPKKYLFNVMETIEVTATSTDEAYDLLNDGNGVDVDRDVMLVEVE